MTAVLRPALMLLATLTVVTGIIYPLVVTGFAQLLFPHQANGSIMISNGRPVGSALIGQAFSSPRHFWGRPSATEPQPYNAAASSGSNLGPLNPTLSDAVKARIEALVAADPDNEEAVPIDLVTASASGLDPDISLAGAYFQAPRVAQSRDLSLERVKTLIAQHAKRPWLGLFGEPRVNALALNIALDQLP